MSFEILSNVPTPKRPARQGGRTSTYPFEQMADGAVLLTPAPADADEETLNKMVNRVRSAAQAWKQRAGATCGFTVAAITEGEHAGKIGCWKTNPRNRKAAVAA